MGGGLKFTAWATSEGATNRTLSTKLDFKPNFAEEEGDEIFFRNADGDQIIPATVVTTETNPSGQVHVWFRIGGDSAVYLTAFGADGGVYDPYDSAGDEGSDTKTAIPATLEVVEESSGLPIGDNPRADPAGPRDEPDPAA